MVLFVFLICLFAAITHNSFSELTPAVALTCIVLLCQNTLDVRLQWHKPCGKKAYDKITYTAYKCWPNGNLQIRFPFMTRTQLPGK